MKCNVCKGRGFYYPSSNIGGSSRLPCKSCNGTGKQHDSIKDPPEIVHLSPTGYGYGAWTDSKDLPESDIEYILADKAQAEIEEVIEVAQKLNAEQNLQIKADAHRIKELEQQVDLNINTYEQFKALWEEAEQNLLDSRCCGNCKSCVDSMEDGQSPDACDNCISETESGYIVNLSGWEFKHPIETIGEEK